MSTTITNQTKIYNIVEKIFYSITNEKKCNIPVIMELLHNCCPRKMTTHNVEAYFTRQEAIKLTRLTGTQLSYLDKLEIISPLKIGVKRPTCLYSWQQIIALRVYAKLREDCSLQTLREAIKYLKDYQPEDLIRDKRLIVCQNQIFWVDDSESIGSVFLQITGANKGQTVMQFTFTLSEVIDEVETDGKDNVINFEERFKLATHAA